MSKFLVLYRSEAAYDGPSVAEMFANTPPEQMEAGMAAWGAWYGVAGEAVVDMGAPLHNATTLAAGEAAPNKTTLTGYTVLEADTMETALELLKQHPHFFMPDTSIEVLEFVAMPGM